MWEEAVLTNPKHSKLYHEKYVPHARSRIIQLQTSTLQPSIVKPFAVIRSKFFYYFLSWNGVVTKMASGLDKTGMRAKYCLQLCTVITAVLGQIKEAFVRIESPD
jgi:hypothetical protein